METINLILYKTTMYKVSEFDLTLACMLYKFQNNFVAGNKLTESALTFWFKNIYVILASNYACLSLIRFTMYNHYRYSVDPCIIFTILKA
jgi:ABC-type uncharacterized transport system permease subunit